MTGQTGCAELMPDTLTVDCDEKVLPVTAESYSLRRMSEKSSPTKCPSHCPPLPPRVKGLWQDSSDCRHLAEQRDVSPEGAGQTDSCYIFLNSGTCLPALPLSTPGRGWRALHGPLLRLWVPDPTDPLHPSPTGRLVSL